MLNHYYAVIMAGGGGTRLWPLSRQAQPKQMLRLIDERSLFQIAVQRLADIFPPERILVVTVAKQAEELRQQAQEIPAENFLLEPLPRGTASVIGLAGVVLRERDPQAIMAVLTSDHFIGNEEKFRRLLLASMQVASDGYLVTLGITPTSPSSGYGYIQRGEPVGTYDGLNVYRVLRFKEKPDEKNARIMLESGDHSWNSGMFIWQVSQIMAEFARQMPDLSGKLEEISMAWNTTKRQDVLDQIWPAIKAETIDYGIMENAQNVAVIPAKDLKWSDVGSWDSLFDVLSPDQDGNIVLGEGHIGVKTSNSLIYVKQKDRLIVTIGVEDLVLVDTGDVLLVCGKSEAQKVRQVVDQLQQEDQDYV